MATYLGKANFLPVANTGVSRAKKLADIYIKSHTDAGGNVSDPSVYQYAIDNYLSPFGDDLSVQQKIAGYQNNMKGVNEKGFDQSITLSSFKREVQNAVYTNNPSLVKDPWTLAQYTSNELDKALFSLNTAIDYLHSQNKSVDQLISYRTELNKMAGAQRELVNNIAQGTSNPNLDGYGYYVKTNPANGALVGAALLPTFAAPADLTDGTHRLENTIGIGNSKIPVYLPVNKNADGSYEARLNGNVWTGTGDTPLAHDSGSDFTDGTFSLADQTKFPVKSFDLQPGQFGRTLSGIDTSGSSVYTYYYKGNDNKVYSINQDSINQFKTDPIMGKKLNDFVPTLGQEDVSNFGSVQPLDSNVIKADRTAVLNDQLKTNAATSDAANAKVQQMNTGIVGAAADVGGVINKAAGAVGGFFSGLLGRKNQPSPPQPSAVSVGGTYSPPDVVASGASFFRKSA